jgi:hypothetical protein
MVTRHGARRPSLRPFGAPAAAFTSQSEPEPESALMERFRLDRKRDEGSAAATRNLMLKFRLQI